MIRKIGLQDRDAYLAMSKAFYRSDAVLHTIPEEHFQTTFKHIIADSPYVEGYIFEDAGKTIGYVLLSFTYSNEAGGLVLLIEEVYILPEFQGQGLGAEFLTFLESTYHDKVVLMRLEVEKSNKTALHLYQKLGFTKVAYLQLYKKPKSHRQKR
ncbi:MAG: GNAT family N-acetyltransferase [Spirochaetia bacterium]|jgi:ribosomal protein S18 acetylase RimI-like enzyme|nr:GNAT family N-acetyltransferase [Spirochaetia bacterium]